MDEQTARVAVSNAVLAYKRARGRKAEETALDVHREAMTAYRSVIRAGQLVELVERIDLSAALAVLDE